MAVNFVLYDRHDPRSACEHVCVCNIHTSPQINSHSCEHTHTHTLNAKFNNTFMRLLHTHTHSPTQRTAVCLRIRNTWSPHIVRSGADICSTCHLILSIQFGSQIWAALNENVVQTILSKRLRFRTVIYMLKDHHTNHENLVINVMFSAFFHSSIS